MNKAALLAKMDEEIEFAKGTGMPQFVMGLLLAKKIIEAMPQEPLEFAENV